MFVYITSIKYYTTIANIYSYIYIYACVILAKKFILMLLSVLEGGFSVRCWFI